MALNWLGIGLTLASLFIFGLGYAWLVRWMTRQGMHGQTAYLVSLGTLMTLIGASAVIGLEQALLVLACFVASGAPMIVEYVGRTQAQNKVDREAAIDIAKELLK